MKTAIQTIAQTIAAALLISVSTSALPYSATETVARVSLDQQLSRAFESVRRHGVTKKDFVIYSNSETLSKALISDYVRKSYDGARVKWQRFSGKYASFKFVYGLQMGKSKSLHRFSLTVKPASGVRVH